MPVLKNPKHELFAQELAKGKTAEESYIAAGYRPSRPHASRLATKGNVRARIAEINNRIVEKAEWDAAKVLQRLGEIVDAKACDFQKPRSQWTDAMERIACDVEDLMERSHDGVQAGDSKSWDSVGTRVKISLAVKVKALELIGKHKAVDAFIQQKPGDVNIVVVTAEKARQIASAKHRLSKVIDVKPITT